MKRVNKSCSDDSIWSEVEGYDRDQCFAACADSGTGGARNVSSACWIGCFYGTVLGPDAGTPGGAVAGMPLDDMLTAWNRPFLPVAAGGCPALPTATAAQRARRVAPRSRWSFGNVH